MVSQCELPGMVLRARLNLVYNQKLEIYRFDLIEVFDIAIR
jgi:hypothetical protein